MPSETAQNLEKQEKRLEQAIAKGSTREIEKLEDAIVVLKRKLKKEEAEIRPHPSLQFGPIWQTVSLMAALSLAMSVSPLPREALAFYTLFSRITILSVICLVVHSSIIYYGYQEAIKKMPKGQSAKDKLREMMKSKPDRPDLWAHTRSHPSQFLTTRHAAPRLFPFPLGKTKPTATVADELWWEGGNAPHVGHFNKPKIPEPTGVDEGTLLERYKTSKAIESQQKLWKKRIKMIQYLCVVIILSFVNRKVAIAGLCWLVYNTFSTELDNMLKPPEDTSEVYATIDGIVLKAGRVESAPKAGKDQPTGGISYIYDPITATKLKADRNVAIPIQTVPPHVLMTSENKYLAGPGEQIKDPNK